VLRVQEGAGIHDEDARGVTGIPAPGGEGAASASGVFRAALFEGGVGDGCGKGWLGIVRDYACGSLAVSHGFTIFAEWGTAGSGIGGWRPGSNVGAGFVNMRFGVVLFGHCVLCMPLLLYEQWSPGVSSTPPAENSYKGRLCFINVFMRMIACGWRVLWNEVMLLSSYMWLRRLLYVWEYRLLSSRRKYLQSSDWSLASPDFHPPEPGHCCCC
jgi:hypothetical protein